MADEPPGGRGFRPGAGRFYARVEWGFAGPFSVKDRGVAG